MDFMMRRKLSICVLVICLMAGLTATAQIVVSDTSQLLLKSWDAQLYTVRGRFPEQTAGNFGRLPGMRIARSLPGADRGQLW
jgi:hypothetical protein